MNFIKVIGMKCTECEKDGTFHNFDFLLRNSMGDGVFYTCPAKGKAKKMTDEELTNYFAHMDEASVSSWIWIIDCSGLEKLEMPNVNLMKKFMESIQERYKFVLKEIYVIHMNWRMSMILHMIRPFMKEEAKKRLIICNSPLQLLKLGVSAEMVKTFF